eukprot:Tamp_06861.p1 GENE.Tamp_06861~~Tamp_06861.p1  ORF type:complete len:769 (+),score=184.16 Tamp_06861:264-2309(+)
MSQAREMGTSRKMLRPGWSNGGGMRAWTAPHTFSNDVLGSRVMATRRSVVSYLDQPPKLPAFVLVDKVVLRFRCWMKDDMALLTGPDRVIIHNCILTYNLIDDSFTIMEPRQENSGLNQGCLLRRQRLQKPNEEGVYTWKDLEVGGQMVVRGQLLHLVDCDEYTRNWYEQQGVVLGPALQAPLDPNEVRENRERKKRRDYEMAKQRRIQSEMMHVEEVKHRFLTYDRKVLRFHAIWDDRNTIFGGKHFITLRYYLFDYTIDMQERHGSADGPKTRFLMRQRIPKNSNQPLTDEEQRTGKTGFITLDDLFVGARLDVFGKTLFIYDADEFTKRYYSGQLGKGMPSIDISEPSVPIPRLPTPPSNGLGAEDDSIQNCKMLRPKPMYRDMAKYKKYAGKVMRFTARWDSERPEETSRSFIISFFPADDTVSIWETSGDGRNTGMASGKFLERMKLYKPGTSGTKLKYYVQSDFTVGATVVAQGRKFVLTSMDEFTARLMDSDDTGQKKKKVQADVLLASRITEEEKAELLKECRIKDKHHTGLLSVEDFMDTIRGKLYAMANSDIMDLVTLCQSDPRDFSGEVDYERFFDAIFEALAADRQRKEEKKQSRAGSSLPKRETSSTVRLPPVDDAKMSPPATRDSVQWADHQDSRNFAMPASDEHWQSGDLDVRLAKPRTLIRNPEP